MKRVIAEGDDKERPYPSRSEAIFAVIHALLRAGYEDATIAAVLLDARYAISQKPLEQKNPRSPDYRDMTVGWVAKEIGRARAKKDLERPTRHGHQRATNPGDAACPGRRPGDARRGPSPPSHSALRSFQRPGVCPRPWRRYALLLPVESWLVWTGTHWQRDEAGTVMQWAKATVSGMLDTLKDIPDDSARDALYKHVKASLSTTSRLEGMVKLAQDEPGIPVLPDALDQHHWLLNCANGTLDLTTGTLRPHTRDDLLTKCLDLAYDPEATCPTWERFLWHIMGGSGEEPDDPDASAHVHEARYLADERARRLIGFLQRAVGYSLTGDTSEHCFFLLYGTGRNGKGTFIETVQAVLGPYGKTAEMSTFLARQTETVRNDLADLHGARFVSASEADKGKRLAESLVKRLTGGDHIKARFLFQEYFEFLPQMHVWLAVNDKPVIRGTDLAMWERIRLMPFKVLFPPNNGTRPGREAKAELPGILAWAVKGCLEWQRYMGLRNRRRSRRPRKRTGRKWMCWVNSSMSAASEVRRPG